MKSIVRVITISLLTLGTGLAPRLPAKDPPAKSEVSGSVVEEAKPDPTLAEKLIKDYPLDTCVVSGDKLGGSMGEAVNYFYKLKTSDKDEVRLVRFCCKDCIKKFKKTPEKYIKKIDDAAKAKAEVKP